ncbi:MAG: flavin-containing monooxygenase [Acidimicrobiales bacterium]
MSDAGNGTAAATAPSPKSVDVLVVGAGFSGLYALHRLRGLGFSVEVVEAGTGLGGTWFWNRYPGARCDVESLDYSYSFTEDLQQEWRWSERYPAQPEVLSYLNHVADRLDLRRDIRFGTVVTKMAYDEARRRWDVRIETGPETGTGTGAAWDARVVLTCTGCLSAAQLPDIEGLSDFAGATFHTARWPHEGVDLTGLRVGVVGTGSTAIQLIPEIAPKVAHLYVFQRTANYSVPNRNAPLDESREREVKARYAEYRADARRSMLGVPLHGTGRSALADSPEERDALYAAIWAKGGGMPLLSAYNDLLVDEHANETVAQFIRDRIAETVKDPDTAELLTPRSYPVGAKRLCQDEGYFATFNRDNVTLVDLRAAPIVRATPSGLETTTRTYDLGAIVFATGFDAVTGALTRIDVRGRGGRTLRDEWRDGPKAYLGIAAAGFPNLLMVTGPGSPSVLSNMVVSIEQHVDWIADLLAAARARGVEEIEAVPEAQDEWADHVREVGEQTLFPRGNSYYVGANVPGKARVFMPYAGGVAAYRERCDQVAAAGYEGLAFAGEREGASR